MYKYKNKHYTVIEIAGYKDPNSKEWIELIVYKQVYVRNTDEFFSKFEKV